MSLLKHQRDEGHIKRARVEHERAIGLTSTGMNGNSLSVTGKVWQRTLNGIPHIRKVVDKLFLPDSPIFESKEWCFVVVLEAIPATYAAQWTTASMGLD